MKDVVGQVYNGFLLRDVLGYVVPGALVLACFIHMMSVATDTPIIIIAKLVPDKGLAYFFLVCLCYICGHFLSGIFFHTPLFGWIFSYSPKMLSADYPDETRERAWSTHRSKYRAACDTIGESMQGQVERHAALLHFTGHVSASFLFSAVYIVVIAISEATYGLLMYLVPIAIIGPGVFSHYRQLSVERYFLERSAIKTALAID